MDGDKFCTACGCELPEDATFCPECGANLDAKTPCDPYAIGHMSKKKLTVAPLILIYGIFALIFGMISLIDSVMLTEDAYNQTIEIVSEMIGFDISSMMIPWSDDMPLLMSISNSFLCISGALAIVDYATCKKGENHKLAYLLCAASAVSALGICAYSYNLSMGIFLCIVGLLVTFFVYRGKESFTG